MLFMIVNRDRKDGLKTRLAVRETHRAWLRQAGQTLHLAGPILDEDGETPIGSLLIIEAESLEAARAFAARDPYAEAGLFASSRVDPWIRTFPEA